MAGAAERGTIGAVVGAVFGALEGPTVFDRVMRAAFWGSIGFSVGVSLQPQPRLRSLSRRERATVRRCARAGDAPDDPRLAPGVVAVAATFSEPIPFERFMFWLFATWVCVLTGVTVLRGVTGNTAGAIGAGIAGAYSCFMCFALSYRGRVLRPRALRSLHASTALLAPPTT